MQYRARRATRINGHDYAPGELIRAPGELRNPRNLISARIIEVAGDEVVDGPALELTPEPEPALEANAATEGSEAQEEAEDATPTSEEGASEDATVTAQLDPLGELTDEEFEALSPQAKGARTRKANEAEGGE